MERSIDKLAVPLTIVAVIVAQTVLVSVWIGGHAEKWDAAADTVKEIQVAQYTKVDADKDLALVRAEIGDVRRRVEVLEQDKRRAVIAARDDTFLVRAGRWFSGKPALQR